MPTAAAGTSVKENSLEDGTINSIILLGVSADWMWPLRDGCSHLDHCWLQEDAIQRLEAERLACTYDDVFQKKISLFYPADTVG